MRKPIITSDLDFAHDICGEAARYFNPDDNRTGAEAIVQVALNGELRERLEKAGEERLAEFGTAQERFRMYMELIEDMVSTKSRKGSRNRDKKALKY